MVAVIFGGGVVSECAQSRVERNGFASWYAARFTKIRSGESSVLSQYARILK